MKEILFLGLILLSGSVVADETPTERPAAMDSGAFFAHEHLGTFRHGLPSTKARELLGAPEQLVVGEGTEDWNYPHQGIHLIIEKDAMGSWVDQIIITAPSTFKTASGAAIGMSLADVRARYKESAHPFPMKDNWIWVGDLKAGLGFEIVNGKVFKIVLGAAPAESFEPLIEGK